MNEGIVIDLYNFGSSHKAINIISKNGRIEKFFLYRPSIISNMQKTHDCLDFLTLIKYEKKSGDKISSIEIEYDFREIKVDFKKLIICSIASELVKHFDEIQQTKKEESFIFNFFYDFLIDIERYKDIKPDQYYSFLFWFLLNLLIFSGTFNYQSNCDLCSESISGVNSYYNLNTGQYVCEKHLKQKDASYPFIKIPDHFTGISRFEEINDNFSKNLFSFIIKIYKYNFSINNLKTLKFLKYLSN
jgi:recombinational DNA repair protein (RecF pathway)